MASPRSIAIFAGSLAYFALIGIAEAGTITAAGNVTALDDITQIPSITGSALFDEMWNGMIPLDLYAAEGLTFHVGELGTILPGVVEIGEVPDPVYTSAGVYFPLPIAGGGVQQSSINYAGGAVTFSDPVTQFGLTAGGTATLYITVWDQSGALLGQVTWEPEAMEAAFVGIDTMGVPIGLLAIGNDDVFGGAEYDDLGLAARSDSWIWGVAAPCESEADCLDDGWSCTAHACEAGACAYPLTAEPCDDGDSCTDTDTCSEGMCIGTAITCGDTSICTFDSCDPERGCVNDPIEGCCLADEDCPEGATCLVGSNTCVGGPPPETGDGDGDTGDGDGDGDGDTETETGDDTEPAADEGGGCGCTAPDRGPGAMLGLLGLILLGTVRRTSREDGA
ncbi:MAG TPA: MYXO-CTERM sorting domain-containing protein [Enhygromyxa sp.]|nr:MYXO-CTERM sorting domain-containing protein [Enhygromyxa sp.]